MKSATVVVISCLLYADSALSAIIRVPEDAPSILAGVDMAAQGDSVLVGPGTWTDKETRVLIEDGLPTSVTACAFPTHGMSIIGTSGPQVTVLDAGGGGAGGLRVITFYDPGPGKLVIQGITIAGMAGSDAGVGLLAVDSDGIVVRNCRFLGDLAGSEDLAIQMFGGDSEIVSTEFTLCSSQVSAVMLFNGGLQMQDCIFHNNYGRCVQVENEFDSSPVSVQRCEFRQNRGRGLGVCMDLMQIADLQVKENTFIENVAEDSYGAALRIATSNANVEFNVFGYDSSLAPGAGGGGLSWEDSIGQVSNNTFVACYSYTDGAAFQAFGGNILSFERNIVAYSAGAAAVQNYGSAADPNTCNLYWLNSEGDFGMWTSSPTDLFSDPLFCDVSKQDFTVREDSPCIVGGCGQIGALEVGCENVSVDPLSWGKIKELYRLGR